MAEKESELEELNRERDNYLSQLIKLKGLPSKREEVRHGILPPELLPETQESMREEFHVPQAPPISLEEVDEEAIKEFMKHKNGNKTGKKKAVKNERPTYTVSPQILADQIAKLKKVAKGSGRKKRGGKALELNPVDYVDEVHELPYNEVEEMNEYMLSKLKAEQKEQRGGAKKKNNKWIKFVKQYAKQHKLKYSEALKEASKHYK